MKMCKYRIGLAIAKKWDKPYGHAGSCVDPYCSKDVHKCIKSGQCFDWSEFDVEKCDDILITGSGKWVCKCRIQDTKPVECREKPCVKNAYPGIDEI